MSIGAFLQSCTNHKQEISKDKSNEMKNLYDYKVESLDGKEINFADFKGKKVLIVNTASECGFTPQYADLEKVAEDFSTSKNFPKHLITVSAKGKIDQKVLDAIIKYINTSDYYQPVRAQVLENTKAKVIINDSIIKQIDGILNNAGSAKNNTSVYINEQSQLNDLINQKNRLVEDNHYFKISIPNLKYIIAPLK